MQDNQPLSLTRKVNKIATLLIALMLVVIGIGLYFDRELDTKIFFAINMAAPQSTTWLTVTNIGDGLFVGCLLLIIFRNRTDILGRSLLGGLAVHFSVQILKRIIELHRPCNTDSIRSLAYIFGDPISPTNYSMPSGHSAAIFMALGIVFLNRKIFTAVLLRNALLVLLLATSILVMMSRIAVGAHWPSDVFAGASLGLCVALAVDKIPIKFSPISSSLIFLLYIPFVALPFFVLSRADDIDSLVSDGFTAVVAFIAGCFLVRNLKEVCLAFLKARKNILINEG